jgi:hypothetical protein
MLASRNKSIQRYNLEERWKINKMLWRQIRKVVQTTFTIDFYICKFLVFEK